MFLLPYAFNCDSETNKSRSITQALSLVRLRTTISATFQGKNSRYSTSFILVESVTLLLTLCKPRPSFPHGTEVTRRTERDHRTGDIIYRRYYICCVEWDDFRKKFKYRLKKTKDGTLSANDPWYYENELTFIAATMVIVGE